MVGGFFPFQTVGSGGKGTAAPAIRIVGSDAVAIDLMPCRGHVEEPSAVPALPWRVACVEPLKEIRHQEVHDPAKVHPPGEHLRILFSWIWYHNHLHPGVRGQAKSGKAMGRLQHIQRLPDFRVREEFIAGLGKTCLVSLLQVPELHGFQI